MPPSSVNPKTASTSPAATVTETVFAPAATRECATSYSATKVGGVAIDYRPLLQGSVQAGAEELLGERPMVTRHRPRRGTALPDRRHVRHVGERTLQHVRLCRGEPQTLQRGHVVAVEDRLHLDHVVEGREQARHDPRRRVVDLRLADRPTESHRHPPYAAIGVSDTVNAVRLRVSPVFTVFDAVSAAE